VKVLVTGSAGFIGSHVAARLLARGDSVVGIDNLNDYYDVSLKQARLERLVGQAGFRNETIDIVDQPALREVFERERPDRIVHLAAQAGVRYSLEHPQAYIDANVTGFLNVLECARHFGTEHLVYASSSSVYGSNERMPFSVDDNVDHPISLYAATKKANELMAHTYSHLFRIPTTGLRFFTVYGPWGRPDMALFHFTRCILAGEPIDVFNHGHHRRDFTYVDDIVEGIVRVLDHVATVHAGHSGDASPATSGSAPYRLYNIGSNNPVQLLRYIEVLEAALGRKAEKRMLPMQPGDVAETYADVTALARDIGYQPSTPIEVGVGRFVEWYRSFYGADRGD
jgi:UDP-glucuronate 4-epimerase